MDKPAESATPAPPVAAETGFVADLTYRSYSGPLSPPIFRWWAIAKMTMRMAVKKKAFWGWALLSPWFLLIQLAVLTVMDQAATGPGRQFLAEFYRTVVWKDLFLGGFQGSLFFLFLAALVIASGNIAADNRANALLVYLSKPTTKLDYLFGKWLGFFLLLLGASGIPLLLTFAYGALTFRQYGFLTQEPWLFPKILLLMTIAPALLSTVAVGVSAQFKEPRLATAAFAGLYFLPLVLSYVMYGILRTEAEPPPVVFTLYYSHIAGLEEGLAKALFDSAGGFSVFGREMRGERPVDPPNGWLTLAVYLAVIGLFWVLAWRKIRAVEVVS